MRELSAAAVERAMKLRDGMLRVMTKRISLVLGTEILGLNCQQMQRWKTRLKLESSLE